MYKLYTAPATAGQAVHWMLIELGVPFEVEMLDLARGEHKGAAYLALNPAGRVPTMLVDGAPHAECTALLSLLAERHPEGGFYVPPGAAERADYLQWMVYFANTVQPAFRTWFYPHEPAGGESQDAVQATARADLEAVWTSLDAHFADGRPFILGERFTTPDFMAAMLMRWSRNMPKPATAWPRLKAYVDRLRARPGLQEVHRREGVTDWIGDA